LAFKLAYQKDETDNELEGHDCVIHLFQIAPALKRLSLNKDLWFRSQARRASIWRKAIIPIPWGQLTHYIDADEVYGAASDFVETLSKMKNIEYLAVKTKSLQLLNLPHPPPSSPIPLHSLKHLSLDFYFLAGPGFFPDCFDVFEFENLVSLRMIGIPELDFDSGLNGPLFKAHNFLNKLRGLRKLEHLSLGGQNHITSSTLEKILEAVPSVKFLDIDFPILTVQKLFDILFYSSALPLLTTFAWVPRSCDGVEMRDRMREFVTSRTEVELQHPLQNIQLYGSGVKFIFDTVEEVIRGRGNVLLEKCEGSRWEHWLFRDPYLDDWKEAREILPSA